MTMVVRTEVDQRVDVAANRSKVGANCVEILNAPERSLGDEFAQFHDPVVEEEHVSNSQDPIPGGRSGHEIKAVLMELAGRKEFFPDEDFPPAANEKGYFPVYRLSEDEDHRFALYISTSIGEKDVPPHNHTTWAVITGVQGEEENRFYERVDDGATPGKGRVDQIGRAVVAPGTGVTLLPNDIHSIHIDGEAPALFLHMYGLGLEQLTARVFFDRKTGDCKVFASHPDIRDAARA
ncbi:MAG: hypothetical protein IH793_05595 [Acidobacteria bacterium]|nr:hypothetical protein [Acidobacteriota bacterium]